MAEVVLGTIGVFLAGGRFLMRLIAALLLGVMLIGCTPAPPAPAPTPTQAPKQSVTVHYGYSSAGTVNAPVLIGETMGFFAEQGIGIDYVMFPSASEVIPAVTRGDVDAAGVGPTPVPPHP